MGHRDGKLKGGGVDRPFTTIGVAVALLSLAAMLGVRMRRRMQPAIALAGSSGYGIDMSTPLTTLSADISRSFVLWDPLDLVEGAPTAHVKNFRGSELQHGQAATLAVFFVSPQRATYQTLTNNARKSVVTNSLFGLGAPELVVILGLGAFVLGPDKLASMAKDFGKVAGELKDVPKEFKEGLEEGEAAKAARVLEEGEKKEENKDNMA